METINVEENENPFDFANDILNAIQAKDEFDSLTEEFDEENENYLLMKRDNYYADAA